MADESSKAEAIPIVDPPWKLNGTVYSFMMWSTSKEASTIGSNKSFLYPQLEGNSNFADGKFLGGLGMVQIIRYTDTPVGPYDELLVCPGSFRYDVKKEGKNGDVKVEKMKNVRITRIYVSQKQTCKNGRIHWNIPKHLARFTFTDLPDKSTFITVQPLDDVSGEVLDKTVPFFSAVFKPVSYLPSFPASTGIAKYVGVDIKLAQPPLPEGKSASGELPGTDRWCKIMPFQSSRHTSIGWWDMKQGAAKEAESPPAGSELGKDGQETKRHENWWPGIGRWRIGMVMEDAEIEFPEGEYWKGSIL